MLRKLAITAATMAVAGGATMGMAYADTPAPAAAPTQVICSLGGGLVGNLLGSNCVPTGHRGDNHHRRGNGNDGRPIIINNGGYGSSYGSSSCGVCNDAVTYVPVQPQIVAVPIGAVATGDGSCGLNQRAFGRLGHRFGGRFLGR